MTSRLIANLPVAKIRIDTVESNAVSEFVFLARLRLGRSRDKSLSLGLKAIGWLIGGTCLKWILGGRDV